MFLGDFVEKLQNKPRYVRVKIMWGCVVVCMVFVVGIWFVTFKHSISLSGAENAAEGEDSMKLLKEAGEKFPTIRESLKANFNSLFEKEEEEEPREYKREEPEVSKPYLLPLSQ